MLRVVIIQSQCGSKFCFHDWAFCIYLLRADPGQRGPDMCGNLMVLVEGSNHLLARVLSECFAKSCQIQRFLPHWPSMKIPRFIYQVRTNRSGGELVAGRGTKIAVQSPRSLLSMWSLASRGSQNFHEAARCANSTKLCLQE